MRIPMHTPLLEFYRAMPQQQGATKKTQLCMQPCRAGLVLLLVQFSLVKLAAEIAAACSNMPLASSSLHHCCSLSTQPVPSPWELQLELFRSRRHSFLLAQAVSSLHPSHVRKEHSPCQAPPCSHLRHRRKGTTMPPSHAGKYVSSRLRGKVIRCQCHKCSLHHPASLMAAKTHIPLQRRQVPEMIWIPSEPCKWQVPPKPLGSVVP